MFGLLMLGGIIAAGASTADGGILGVSAVLGRNILQRNILRPMEQRRKALVKDKGQEISDEEAKIISDRKLLIIARIMAIPVVALAIWIAIVKPEPGMLLVLAFDVVFAGCLVPLTLGIYWKKANTPGALAAIFVGSILRLYLYYTIPEALAGLDTLIPPVVSLIVMVVVSLATQKQYPPKHHVINEVPDDTAVLSGEA
jgi:Na+/proline symporter